MSTKLGNRYSVPLKLTSLLSRQLVAWYQENKRELPWRSQRDPYRIWISEVMLQQTTVVAVIPYYERFLKRFSTVQALAQAPLAEVLESWAGLGYYSRARNLHKAAQSLAKRFPLTAEELLELPGFGPYTSRAVASLAFDQAVGVLDGNVIRVLTRVFGLKIQWWNQKERQPLQWMSDQLATHQASHLVNNGLMELGATVCTPTTPLCLLCPWKSQCQSFAKGLTAQIPLKKPRKRSEVWVWSPRVLRQGEKVALIANDYAPFLKGQMIFPGHIQRQKNRPKTFDLKHGITHHDIYIQIEQTPPSAVELRKIKAKDLQWIHTTEIKKINPSSLLQKVLLHPHF